MTKLIDLTGQEFGRLKVLDRALHSKNKKVRWLCQSVRFAGGERPTTKRSCGR